MNQREQRMLLQALATMPESQRSERERMLLIGRERERQLIEEAERVAARGGK